MAISIGTTAFSSPSSTPPCLGRQFHRFRVGGWDRPAGFHAASRHLSIKSSSISDLQRSKSKLESLFCYDKSIPEEIIEQPVGLSLNYKEIGNNPPCNGCHAKGAVLCATCSGSGLYVESILESQGIIVKVRCLGCGGTGNIMCSECGGRGHI